MTRSELLTSPKPERLFVALPKLARESVSPPHAPWLKSRFRLISWMEILRFSADAFFSIGRATGIMVSGLKKFPPDAVLGEDSKPMLSEALKNIRGHCELVGLTMSIKSIDRVKADVEANKTVDELRAGWKNLDERISDEIADSLFLFIPSSHAPYYQANQLFGQSVEQAFPSISPEIHEAGKCLALHRNTAAVCHLMRALESGLRTLAQKLNVPFSNKTWNTIIEVAEKRLKKMRGAKRKPKNWKEDERFYSEAIAHFRFIKDAWRNYSMHVYERYDEEQAESVFNHTKAFMRHLATKLQE